MQGLKRCGWAAGENMIQYHDQEWGVPLHDDRLLFEFLILEGAQAGLSWSTILNKRETYRVAFDNFDANIIACDLQRRVIPKNIREREQQTAEENDNDEDIDPGWITIHGSSVRRS